MSATEWPVTKNRLLCTVVDVSRFKTNDDFKMILLALVCSFCLIYTNTEIVHPEACVRNSIIVYF